jgi:hypothetical protein
MSNEFNDKSLTTEFKRTRMGDVLFLGCISYQYDSQLRKVENYYTQIEGYRFYIR